MKIYKYQLEVTGSQNIKMKRVEKFLDVKVVENKITLWAIVDENTIERFYTFKIIGTGEQITEDIEFMKYLGTVVLDTSIDSLVWHIFQVCNS